MYLIVAVLITVALLAFTLLIRRKDLPPPVETLPWQHLEDRKRAIYENLRDLNFEYRVGKLSDEDYQRTKVELQNELAAVLAGIDKMKGAPAPAKAASKAKAGSNGASAAPGYDCPHCSAHFDRPLKFCGECGKPMSAEVKA